MVEKRGGKSDGYRIYHIAGDVDGGVVDIWEIRAKKVGR